MVEAIEDRVMHWLERLNVRVKRWLENDVPYRSNEILSLEL